ncbi:MAG: signal recognition particle-docking protein FtsY [Erysipelotrichaceae bacterium]
MGIFDKLKQVFKKNEDADLYLSGLSKSRISFSQRLQSLKRTFVGLDDNFLEELMIVLLEADVGIKTAEKIVSMVEKEALKRKLKSFEQIAECLIEQMELLYAPDETLHQVHLASEGPSVILLVGVNGSGKTTSTAKLAYYFKNQGMQVAVAAADTFRAGAIDQLQMWAERLDIPCIAKQAHSDPSAVLVDATRESVAKGYDLLIGDTAGRLQNKANLMKELEKMHRVVGKEIEGAPHEVWLVIDATTGQNGISQAQIFMETTQVTGIVLTKMDGTAKGGIVLAIRDLLGLPVKFIGLGEKVEDLKAFDLDSYLYSLSEGLLGDEHGN